MLVAEPVLSTSKIQREIMTQILFEKFNANGLYMADQPRLALASYGKVSGCVIDVGHDSISAACVTEGQLQQPSCEKIGVAGRHMTEAFRLMAETALRKPTHANPPSSPSSLSDRQAEQLKFASMEVSSSGAEFARVQGAGGDAHEYVLPDGSAVTLDRRDVLHCAEALLFEPAKYGGPRLSMADLAEMSIASMGELPARKTLAESMLVVGGGSAIKGLEQRFLHDVRQRFPPMYNVALLRRPDYMPQTCPKYSTWVGAFIEAKLSFTQNQQVTKYDYDECGPSIIHKKAFL